MLRHRLLLGLLFLRRGRWNLRDPKLRILPLDIVDHQRRDENNGGRQQKHRKVVPPQSPDRGLNARKQCCRSSRRVRRLGKMHDHESNRGRQASRKPLQTRERIVLEIELEDGRDNDTDQSAEEVTEYQSPRLRQRDIDSTVR